ncbi:TPA: hypothetical protein ACRNUD_002562 [Pseudomonas aeruginosa]|uniref:hypothetical protein n=1 Tax=Pseudomonas aeruginosa TaxID=287 RepID=UPI0003B9BC36|nr:hypothetical protein [Pseudomonas aeruginosa]ERV29458.1 hypothetical protein Q070_02430 [Pseudomonas aeruginosa BL16]KRU89669.1 hypothetical protein AN452_00795 [Pseudomonas aeruginosa]KRV39576.1 hypothetical protein AN461_10345 [Pseudomonas aeruginosa]MBH4181582.1 hypothetical protein [Pseudomonas aeruginosa]MBH8790471.1 hypothetical protein [Pseudomonas aeruginosa]
MSEVERFNEYTWGVTEDEHGEYVRYADYDALAAEAQALRQEVAALRARADVVPEVFGLERYRVEKTGKGFWPYCVRAGDGTRELFVGHLKQCQRVATELATAFEDGKFIAAPGSSAQHSVLKVTGEMIVAALDAFRPGESPFKSMERALNAALRKAAAPGKEGV